MPTWIRCLNGHYCIQQKRWKSHKSQHVSTTVIWRIFQNHNSVIEPHHERNHFSRHFFTSYIVIYFLKFNFLRFTLSKYAPSESLAATKDSDARICAASASLTATVEWLRPVSVHEWAIDGFDREKQTAAGAPNCRRTSTTIQLIFRQIDLGSLFDTILPCKIFMFLQGFHGGLFVYISTSFLLGW